MLMKTAKPKNLFYRAVCSLLLVLTLGLGVFSLQSKTYTYAANFTNQTIDNGKFSMVMTANARKQTSLPLDSRTITNVVGDDVTYLCFKWSELENLRFRFNANIKGQATTFKSYKFLLTNVQTDDLDSTLGVKEPKVLYQGNISSNNFSQFDFYYYIDKNSEISETALRCKGNDFGLYKFDFVYAYLEDSVEISVSIGAIYVAVLPDDVDTIPQTDLRILYSVSSSNKLMNIFNLYLSSSAYKYVNPKYIQWSVVGVDKLNANYILTQKAKDENIDYANYKVVWQSLASTTGSNFIFDSNDIEGTWTVHCTIKNSNGSEKTTLIVNNLSTIKKEPKSFVWLVLAIIAAAIVVIGIIVLIVVRKKKEKVW